VVFFDFGVFEPRVVVEQVGGDTLGVFGALGSSAHFASFQKNLALHNLRRPNIPTCRSK